ncbi:Ig-like domain-containing protein [Microbacterium sp. VKM Ac-2923]|uniref:Ig-like domain-containing protein n=1 Tax=Microbacterium sp. VKM Ac-2923 TaxID=2929476 RepID=UPI001FB2C645|nr:Ig-like domain-containing protein [Microbacterium sp. VKM Ac-2923]MCJ1706323.1 Ig-like domain-containing protein [Microbacterium sp. VKM Ac-2923]
MKRGTLAGLTAAAVSAALVVTASIVWPGLDAQQTPEVDTSVWALQTGDGQRYARVNTAVGELDTVRTAGNPTQVAQSGDGAYLFTDSFSKLTRIDEALPVDLQEEQLQAAPDTPPGTTSVVTAGDYVVYRTDVGTLFAGRLSRAGQAAVELDPFEVADDDDAAAYTADALALDDRGMLFAYSSADGSVLRYDIESDELRGRDALDVDAASPVLSAAGDTWVLVDAEAGRVWVRGEDAVDIETGDQVVIGDADADARAVYIADDQSLWTVPADGSEPRREVGGGGNVLGQPARPVWHQGVAYAAWLLPGDARGTLWRSDQGETGLDYGGATMPDQRRPTFVATDHAVILNETRTGWVWTVPDGALVASSQNWSLDDRTEQTAVQSDEQLSVVLDPKPPIAEPDSFGVRPGRLVTLPVLLNDHDPNEDVLSIVSESVTGLDPGFGTLALTDSGQRLAVRVSPTATGSATFSYAVTDGTTADGLTSAPTTVTVAVSPADSNAAPVWCGVAACLQPWPTPEVARGGTITVPVLAGWIDPDGDPLLLLSVDNPGGVGTVAATPGGDVVYQHADDGSGGEQNIELEVVVADTRGATTTKPLLVRVAPDPGLSVQSFAVIDTVGSSVSVDVGPRVTGTAGDVTLTSVRVLDGADATATVLGGSTAFEVTAAQPGVYRVDFTVNGGGRDANGTARVTMLPADAPAQLSTSPVVAFVRPQEDATLDVFRAVSNPTGRVLLLSEVEASAEEGASLTVDTVGQNDLRVSGSTADGAAGLLGTVGYTVSDGTDDEGSRVAGEATVYLLPPAPEIAPIAVDDTVTVRAGAQIDIPVLDNDISPAGGRPTLDPSSVQATPAADALAFASGGVLRYLAPTTPGAYEVTYRVTTAGTPSLWDQATVRVTVLGEDANRAPLPDTLEGRVLSGGTTSIDFAAFGIDPDGDAVTLDRVVAQPDRGTASVSPDGTSILYSSIPGDRGQVSFRYRVSDSANATGEGSVRIGVLDAEANPSPITFTEYVQVQADADRTVRVSPLANDIDPTQGRLTLTGVRPDLPETLIDGSDNPEYERLEGFVVAVSDTAVVLRAGAQPGTLSFLYDVASESGNTGRGLIVVKVVRENVPDYPIVTDTVLTVENRDDFASGVDVIAGRATWSGGELGDLDVELWGEPADVRIDGRRISGALPATRRVIPFAVTGRAGDTDVTTYAFLRVPGDDDLSLSLRPNAAQRVDELASVSFDMASLVALPRRATLEVGAEVTPTGVRPEARCSLAGSVVTYDAGNGSPWTDACRVPVRVAGSEEWTVLSVPIGVVARDPQPELRPGALTVGPGETATFDLRNMTSWQLGREDAGGVRYALESSGSAFAISLDGSTVSVTGDDRALPGTENAAIVSITSHRAVAPARLVLRVGSAPSTLPQGGTTSSQCSQASGTSCTIDVIGIPGEVNPLPGTPLEVVAVSSATTCTGVSFAVASPTSIAASWNGDTPGATCTAAVTLRDAQGRTTASVRDARVTLDLLGFPRPPASVRQTAFADGSLTLRVDPGEAGRAYPGLSGFTVRTGGATVGRCAADGSCPPIAAPNGEQREYVVTAVNAVGESRGAVRTTGWAYRPPAQPRELAFTPTQTSGEGKVADLVVSGVDGSETGSLEISSPVGETVRVDVGRNQDVVQVRRFVVGSNDATSVTVRPISRFTLPPGLGGAANGSELVGTAHGVGAPTNPMLIFTSTPASDGTTTIVARATAAQNGTDSVVGFGIVPEGRRCVPREDGDTAQFTERSGETYRYTMCAESFFGDRSYGVTSRTEQVGAVQSTKAPKGYTFTVGSRPGVDPENRVARWRIERINEGEAPPRRNDTLYQGFDDERSSVFDRDPEIKVHFRHQVWGTESERGDVMPASGSAPYQVQATWSLTSCEAGGVLLAEGSSVGDRANVVFTYGDVVYRDAAGAEIAKSPDNPQLVPAGAVTVEGINVSVDWSKQGWNLDPAAAKLSGSCRPAP